MARYLTKVRDTLQRFTEWTIEKIRRTENGRADALAGIAASLPIKEAILLPIHVQTNPFVAEASTCNTIEAKQTDSQEWTNDIIGYLRTGALPEDPKQAHKIRVQAARFTLIGGHLYKRTISSAQGSFARILLAHNEEGCGSLCKKMQQMSKACPHTTCVVGDIETNFRPLALRAVGHGHSGTPPTAPAQKKFLLVATDYFSKWVEAEAYASIKDKDVTKFVWKNIICRFRIPQIIIADNGPQFDKATNKTLITALKKRLEQAKGKWMEELPGVLWAYRTTPGRPTGNTPFALTYGMDAIIPTEIGLPTIWTKAGPQDDTNEELGRNLDWADEVRETASIRMADYQQRASAHYNRKARPKNFKMVRWSLEKFSKILLK
ncbi:hypothetical protein CK203_099091 [Vitis vinifera]|uniref:Integrase catalytic domain-containing protein n=1 Tax=Vitis vinifera TaxID=29760 RepID=A0A438BTR0_VITVI|nr:hypothetical protein CK203_099091 [Vitis vinifera]